MQNTNELFSNIFVFRLIIPDAPQLSLPSACFSCRSLKRYIFLTPCVFSYSGILGVWSVRENKRDFPCIYPTHSRPSYATTFFSCRTGLAGLAMGFFSISMIISFRPAAAVHGIDHGVIRVCHLRGGGGRMMLKVSALCLPIFDSIYIEWGLLRKDDAFFYAIGSCVGFIVKRGMGIADTSESRRVPPQAGMRVSTGWKGRPATWQIESLLGLAKASLPTASRSLTFGHVPSSAFTGTATARGPEDDTSQQ